MKCQMRLLAIVSLATALWSSTVFTERPDQPSPTKQTTLLQSSPKKTFLMNNGINKLHRSTWIDRDHTLMTASSGRSVSFRQGWGWGGGGYGSGYGGGGGWGGGGGGGKDKKKGKNKDQNHHHMHHHIVMVQSGWGGHDIGHMGSYGGGMGWW